MKLISILLNSLCGKSLLADISSVARLSPQPGKSNSYLIDTAIEAVTPSSSEVGKSGQDLTGIDTAFQNLPGDSKLKEFIENHPIPIEVTGSISNVPGAGILLGKPLIEPL